MLGFGSALPISWVADEQASDSQESFKLILSAPFFFSLSYLELCYCSTMALRKTLAQRLFNISKVSTQTLTNCRISNPAVLARSSPNPSTRAPDPGDNGIFRRFLHRTSMFSPAIAPDLRRLPTGEKLVETLRAMDISRRERVRLDGLSPPAMSTAGLTVEDAKKLLRVAQMEAVKSRIRRIENSCISYPEFVRICGENCGDSDQGVEFAKALDESGAVIVLGKNVFLRPDQENEKL